MALVAYVGMRQAALGRPGVGSGGAADWVGALAGFGRSLELLFVPLRLRATHLPAEGVERTVTAALGLIGLVGLASAVVWCWARRPRIALGAGWIPAALAPVFGVVALALLPVAERFVFLPSVGLALLAAAVGAVPAPGRRRVVAACIVAAALLSAMRLPVYRTDHALFESIVEDHPDYYLGHFGLGQAQHRAGRPDLALAPLEQAVRLEAGSPLINRRRGEASRALARVYFDLGREDEAIAELERAWELQPDNGPLGARLGFACMKAKRFERAEQVLRRAVALEPDVSGPMENLALVLARREAFDEALPYLERAAVLEPDRAELQYNLGNCRAALERYDDAARAFRRALAIDPGHADARRNLKIISGRGGS